MIALTGAQLSNAKLDETPIQWWASTRVCKGSRLDLGHGIAAEQRGARAYMAVADGGIEADLYLGSAASFPLGQFGGAHGDGRVLQAGDTLEYPSPADSKKAAKRTRKLLALSEAEIPMDYAAAYGCTWSIGVLCGPQCVPEYITAADAEAFLSAEWEVSHNASRLGIRLIGPKLQFSRAGGGEGGSHPSNLIDNAYPIGGINLTGDSPVVLTVDGPSLGGFICPFTVPHCELWKIGQLRPQDRVRFVEMTVADALASGDAIDAAIAGAAPTAGSQKKKKKAGLSVTAGAPLSCLEGGGTVQQSL